MPQLLSAAYFFAMEHPIDLYTAAIRKFNEGDRASAAEDLSRALGATSMTPAVESAVEILLDPESLAHKVTLRLLSYEANKASRRTDE